MRPELVDREHFVYRIYAGDGALLYVGATCHLAKRIYIHSRKRGGATADRTGALPNGVYAERNAFWIAQSYPNRRAALNAERIAIQTEAPEFNVKHKKEGAAA